MGDTKGRGGDVDQNLSLYYPALPLLFTTPPSPFYSLPEKEVCPQAQDLDCGMLPCGGILVQGPKVSAHLPVDSVS